jgi:hypothetical protein
LGDSIKFIKHLKGAHAILVKTSNPDQINSSVVGRFLFKWYLNFEKRGHFVIFSLLRVIWKKCWKEDNLGDFEMLLYRVHMNFSDDMPDIVTPDSILQQVPSISQTWRSGSSSSGAEKLET